MKLNEKIAECRRRMGISQEELASRIGVSRQAVSKWELGDATPEVDKIMALARVFDISTDELLGHERQGRPVERTQDIHFEEAARAFEGAARENTEELPRGLRIFGRVIRKWGHVAGYIVALRGLGVAAMGFLARWMFGRMFSLTVNTGMESIIVSQEGFPLDGAELMLEGAALPFATGTSGMFDAMSSIPLTFANLIILFGVLMMLGGLTLAWYLKKKGSQPQ